MVKKFSFCGSGTLLGAVLLVASVYAHEWMAPKDAARVVNPVTLTNESVIRGGEIFRENCPAGHGERGEGCRQ